MGFFAKTIRIIAFFAIALIAASPAGAAISVGDFELRAWPGPALKIHYVEPEDAPADAPIVIVMHGVNRNADDYRDNWIDIASDYGFRVYAPEFDAARFPGAQNYNLGAVGPAGVSAFDAIDPLFDAIKQRIGSDAESYVLFAHSAGAQFAHRFVLFRPASRASLVIAANAGWYTMPTTDASWPYGFGGDDVIEVDLAAAFQKPLLILLGADDNDPNAPYLRQTPEARAQGAHRFERGHSFLATAQDHSRRLQAPLSWRIEITPGVGHNNALMAKAAADIIQQASKREAQ